MMRNVLKKHCFLFVLVVMALLLSIIPVIAEQSGDEIVFVVHKSNPVNKLQHQEIKNIFLGKKKTWENNEPVVLVVQQNSKIHETFTRQVLVKSPLQFSIYWKKKLFTGKGLPPHSVKNDQEVIQFVLSNPNCIGYITKSSLPDSLKVVITQ